jgi:hypothetical protein
VISQEIGDGPNRRLWVRAVFATLDVTSRDQLGRVPLSRLSPAEPTWLSVR